MKSNLLYINLEKCCFMHFNPVKRLSNNNNNEQNGYTLQINGTIIPEVQETKLLGVIIDNKLSWIPHIHKLHKKLKLASGLLKRISSNISRSITNHYTMLCLRATCPIVYLYLDMSVKHTMKTIYCSETLYENFIWRQTGLSRKV